MARIVTHSNTFHPDELLAIAWLQRTVLAGQDVAIVRTRDAGELKAAKDDPEVFVIDVGFEHDDHARNFDHHQSTLAVSWPDGTPYSACGLVWRWLRTQGALADCGDEMLDALEDRLIRRADLFDNGLGGPWVEGEMLASYNRNRAETGEVGAFDRALRAAGELIDNTVYALKRELAARHDVERALAETLDLPHQVLVMPSSSSDRYAMLACQLSDGAVNLVITRRTPGVWTLVTTPVSPDEPFSRKTPAPESWRGRTGFEVEAEGHTVTVDFCHKNGFITVVRGSLEAVRAVARLVCETAHPELAAQAILPPASDASDDHPGVGRCRP